MKRFNLLIFAATLFIFIGMGFLCLGDKKNKFSHYDIVLSIDPESGNVSVKGKLDINLENFKEKELLIYLDSSMIIEKMCINGTKCDSIISDTSDSRYMPVARKISLKAAQISGMGKHAEILFSYKGKLSKLPPYFANVTGKEWTEIGLYLPWFPYCPESARLFTFNVTVKNVNGYEIYGLGEVEKRDDVTRIVSRNPTTDIVICMSRDVKHVSGKISDAELSIYHNNFSNEFASELSEEVSNMLALLEEWTGSKLQSGVTIIESQRTMGGGYARMGGVVLGGIDQEKYKLDKIPLKRYFAHEIAHLWWFRANPSTWEDWLNESFAEYSALMVLREREGNATFNRLIEIKKVNSDSTPAIWNFDRNGSDNKTVNKVIYDKGAVLLSELEQKIGKEQFIELYGTIIKENISTTAELLSLISKKCSPGTDDWFENLLKTR